eukprot:CAMPEP_0176221488 /NCGR_PEP_ID=MMETSP0121_2-20121125/19752_1 /TAXON_ID=160619 /ORGANISM="Kryptoperidinium foliaceum, Strain CCMP 1326" /LENGTH=64 /DNA_ID=CAMNT_0017560687 /DNA_START=60 /DNA_END=250 /DNA_ORIENTATION=+
MSGRIPSDRCRGSRDRPIVWTLRNSQDMHDVAQPSSQVSSLDGAAALLEAARCQEGPPPEGDGR